MGKNRNVLNHQGKDHHLLDPHPHPHPHYIAATEERVVEIPSQKLIAFEKILAIADRYSLFAGCFGRAVCWIPPVAYLSQ